MYVCVYACTYVLSGAVWSIDLRPDQRGLATGGSDSTVKFWNFELADRGTFCADVCCAVVWLCDVCVVCVCGWVT